jgi:uncharacterized alpha-E superfamily protein
MLSRVAESIYWMCRLIERAENIARFIDVNHHLMLDLPVRDAEQWEPLVTITGDIEPFRERYGEATQENVVQFLTFDDQYPNSILSCLRAARESARTVREVVSSEMWQQVNMFYLMVNAAARTGRAQDDPHGFFDEVKRGSHLLTGITEDTMSHGEAWHFARMGRLIERADKTSRILDVKYFLLLPEAEYVGTPYDNIQWAAVLKSASGLEMYRKRYHRIMPRQVAEFLLLDREFPRAVHLCLIEAEESLHAITGSPLGTFRNPAERRLGRLRAELDYTDIDEVIRAGMHEYLDSFQVKLNDVGQAVFDTFFALRPAPAAGF